MNPRVVITGAAGGLGLPMAAACIREGAHVLFVGTDASRLATAIAASGAAPGQAVPHVADLTDSAATIHCSLPTPLSTQHLALGTACFSMATVAPRCVSVASANDSTSG